MKTIIAILTSIFCAFSSFTGLFAKQVETIDTFTEVEKGFYIMDYKYDYDVDKMLKNGVNTHVGLFLQGFANIFNGAKGFACTTFNSENEDGDKLLSRNFDYMESPLLYVWTHPENGYASMSAVSLYFFAYSMKNLPSKDLSAALTLLAPYAPLDGINEKGLSVGVLEVEKNPVFQITRRPNLTTTTMIRACLDKAATVDEAIEIFKSHDMRDLLLAACSYHYHIADAHGNTCVIEYVDGEMNILYPGDAGYMAATNFILTDGVDDPLGMGQDRYDLAMSALDRSNGVTSETQAMKILQDCSMKDADLHGYICSTLWSTVYNMTDKTVDIVFYLGYDHIYKFSLDEPCVIQNQQ